LSYLQHLPTVKNKDNWSNYWASAPVTGHCLALNELWQNRVSDNLLVITANIQEAEQYYQTLNYLANQTTQGNTSVHYFQDYEVLPYDMLSYNRNYVSARLQLYHQLISEPRGHIVVAAISTLMGRVVPKSFISSSFFQFKVGQSINLQHIENQLALAGYQRVPIVTTIGTFAVRGAVIDMYISANDMPIRIEFFDDEIESIRFFDPFTQRTIRQIKQFNLMPAGEFDFSPKGVKLFQQQWLDHLPDADADAMQVSRVAKQQVFKGIESFFPLFFDSCDLLFDYFEQLPFIFVTEGVQQAAMRFEDSFVKRYQDLAHQSDLLPPKLLFADVSEVNHRIKICPKIIVKTGVKPYFKTIAKFESINRKQLRHQVKQLVTAKGTIVVANNLGQLQFIKHMLNDLGLRYSLTDNWQQAVNCAKQQQIALIEAKMYSCVALQSWQIVNIDALCQVHIPSLANDKTTTKTVGIQANNPLTLNDGDFVVHLEHGIGIYKGLTMYGDSHNRDEFVVIEYLNQERLYVPISDLHFVSPYNAGSNLMEPKLNSLSGQKWQREVNRIKQKTEDIAANLLLSHSKRKLAKGLSLVAESKAYQNFVDEFEFQETQDQLKAIDEVIADMQKPSPMNRLISGDVGFGKTEVAMRAAFIAFNNRKQTIILVPTTLLANQHYNTFTQRFSNCNAVIANFSGSKTQQDVVTAFNDHQIDIVVATHKVLFHPLNFEHLGLIILDEEHRFGVKQKEQLKSFNLTVDQLYMTATPIPRTLNMALADIMDISIIAQPPQSRLAINTIVANFSMQIVKESIQRELSRGGQVFYLQNKINRHQYTKEQLLQAFPQARIAIAHGQLPSDTLERTMFNFSNHQYDILICTTIIETGIDIPNANTIIIEHAENFGLAQLHQIRGRVGRSFHQAYAYLLTTHATMTQDAKLRLNALEQATALGSGFNIASSDLEIRGAGEILGEKQSGQIQRIGVRLYLDILQQAVNQLKGDKNLTLQQNNTVQLKLQLNCFLPETYIADILVRLPLYHQLSTLKTEREVDAFQIELQDRFGALPEEVLNLLAKHKIELLCKLHGIDKISCSDEQIRLSFSNQTTILPEQIVFLMQKNPNYFKFENGNQLIFLGSAHYSTDDKTQRFEAIKWLITSLTATLNAR